MCSFIINFYRFVQAIMFGVKIGNGCVCVHHYKDCFNSSEAKVDPVRANKAII